MWTSEVNVIYWTLGDSNDYTHEIALLNATKALSYRKAQNDMYNLIDNVNEFSSSNAVYFQMDLSLID